MDSSPKVLQSKLHQGSDVEIILKKRSTESIDECLPVRSEGRLHEFGKTFAMLAAGLEKIPTNFNGDVILFVGNTGVGKSSLVHTLADDSASFVAREIAEDTGDFYIDDTSGTFVKNTTIDSTTTYPEAVVDAATGLIFFDTPGFRDTRSAIHEIVATYGLRRVAELSKRVKIALLVNFNSLTASGPRDDFTNTLGSFFSLFNNTQKFRDSTYLIATKTENRYVFQKGEFIPVSSQTYIKSIIRFLDGVVHTLNNHDESFNDGKFRKNAQELIESLVQGSGDGGDVYQKIALFMKPEKAGPIKDSLSIQKSVESIREKLLSNDGYVDVTEGDFGFTISDRAQMYIRNLYDLLNSHIEEVSKSFVSSFSKFISSHNKDFVDMRSLRSSLLDTNDQVGNMIRTVNASVSPLQYVDAILLMSDRIKMKLCNRNVLDDIKQLTHHLDGIRELTGQHHYTPNRWSESLYITERLVRAEMIYYDMLDNLYNKITDYSFLDSASDSVRMDLESGRLDEKKVGKLLKQFGLSQPADLTPDRLAAIDSFLRKVIGKQTIECNAGLLVMTGTVLRTSSLNAAQMAKCTHATTVMFLATKKLYIDSDFGGKGRNLVVIAPEWHVMGKFTLSVDGESMDDIDPGTAPMGQEGFDGKPGQSAGKFGGVGLRFFKSHLLTISACGGNGQKGQDGGDGENGFDGWDGERRVKLDDQKNIYVLYNTLNTDYIIKGNYGSEGGNAGRGGFGGVGGLGGFVNVHSLSADSPDHSVHRQQPGQQGGMGANGRPGRGGIRGCDVIETNSDRYILFFNIGRVTKKEFVNCKRRNSDGGLLPRRRGLLGPPQPAVPSPPNPCNILKMMTPSFAAYDDIVSHETSAVFQKKFRC